MFNLVKGKQGRHHGLMEVMIKRLLDKSCMEDRYFCEAILETQKGGGFLIHHWEHKSQHPEPT